MQLPQQSHLVYYFVPDTRKISIENFTKLEFSIMMTAKLHKHKLFLFKKSYFLEHFFMCFN